MAQETKVTSTAGIGTLNWRDVINGLLVAVLGAGLTTVQQLLMEGGKIDWKVVGIAALTAGVGYLIKNIFTPASVRIIGVQKEDMAEVKTTVAKATNSTEVK